MKPKVFILYASAGEGHKKIAQAIYQEFKDFPQFPGEVQLVDILDYAPSFFKNGYQLTYRWAVNHAPLLWSWGYWFFNQKFVLFLLTPLRRFFNSFQMQKLTRYLEVEKPDWVIHTHFLAPSILGTGHSKKSPSYRMLSIVTDFKVHGFWINPEQELYVGMCEATRQELLRWGIPEEKIALWGIPVHPKFRRHAGRSLLMNTLSLDPARKTILLTSGGFGMGPAEKILDLLNVFSKKIQVLMVTGNNKKLYEKLRHKKYDYPVHVLGYTHNMDELMEVSDLAVVKPGGSTVCELLVKGCPFFLLKPIPGQEEGNAEVLVLEGISQTLEKPEDFLAQWQQLEDSEIATRLKDAIANFAKPEAGLRIVEYIHAQLTRTSKNPI